MLFGASYDNLLDPRTETAKSTLGIFEFEITKDSP